MNDYLKQLAHHDWFYMMADDNRSYNAGREAEQKLAALATRSPEHHRAYQEWCEWRRLSLSQPEHNWPRPRQGEEEQAA